ncbi:hypothetical protein [Paracoccus sp. ME4]|uniref:hypothetical protein n=1 Tax=Paracoccus sp. ME4 TaxID=3138066 RepID=UPI00398B86AB
MHDDFATCPTCNGTSEDADGNWEGCATCSGSGQRPLTPENLQLAITGRDWADQRVAEFFGEWSRLTGTFAAYGVEGWELRGDVLHITQDISCRGCHDTTDHRFPAEMLFADPARRRTMIMAQLEEKARTDARARERWRELEIERLQQRLAELTSPQNP